MTAKESGRSPRATRAVSQGSATGFIDIWGLQTRVQARRQLLDQLPGAPHIASAEEGP